MPGGGPPGPPGGMAFFPMSLPGGPFISGGPPGPFIGGPFIGGCPFIISRPPGGFPPGPPGGMPFIFPMSFPGSPFIFPMSFPGPPGASGIPFPPLPAIPSSSSGASSSSTSAASAPSSSPPGSSSSSASACGASASLSSLTTSTSSTSSSEEASPGPVIGVVAAAGGRWCGSCWAPFPFPASSPNTSARDLPALRNTTSPSAIVPTTQTAIVGRLLFAATTARAGLSVTSGRIVVSALAATAAICPARACSPACGNANRSCSGCASCSAKESELPSTARHTAR
mmetsp:Transcript_10161/g.24968  ORF Transcript_10161/g.24968 Transcript_10161/m.24968 type:complete len:284 (-) Transcript_10161:862-1713(-)